MTKHIWSWANNFEDFKEEMYSKILDNLEEKSTSWRDKEIPIKNSEEFFFQSTEVFLKNKMKEYTEADQWVSVANIAFMLWERRKKK